MSTDKPVLNVSQLARVLGKTEASIRAAVYRGSPTLPRRIDGYRLLWRAAVVERWLKAQQKKG